jgi:chromosome segregation ATPase
VTYQAPEAQAPRQPISFAASVSASGSHLGGAQTNYYNHMNHHDQRKFFLDAKASDYDQYSDDIALLKKVEGLKKEKDEAEDELVEVKRKKKKFEAALIEAERKFEGEQAKNQVLTEKIQALTAENTELKQEMRAERQAAKAAKQLRESTAAMQKQISDLQAAKTNGCIIA